MRHSLSLSHRLRRERDTETFPEPHAPVAAEMVDSRRHTPKFYFLSIQRRLDR